jgi:serine/threonine-protein kinase HipA
MTMRMRMMTEKMTVSSRQEVYGVWLYRELVGYIRQVGDHTVFRFTDDYLGDPERSVLGLAFEERLTIPMSSHLRLPPWFSNLLPEGQLREWIASDRGVSADREMELLAQVGHDLSGAVQVVKEDSFPDAFEGDVPGGSVTVHASADDRVAGWRFSLAGVGMKFSMIQQGDKLSLPAFGEGGDWIVKFPDPVFDDVPVNENAMMDLAGLAGIQVPEHRLIHREELENLPAGSWRSSEQYAYAVRRFDRGAHRELIHIEDLAQVRNMYPYGGGKYQGNFETVASLAYRNHDVAALQQVARRLAFNVLISNGDAHLKNWSLIYRDRRRPTLAPAYDVVSTEMYRSEGDAEDFGLKFGKSRLLSRVDIASFARLESRLRVEGAGLADCASDTVHRALAAWPQVAESLGGHRWLREQVEVSLARRRATLLRSAG